MHNSTLFALASGIADLPNEDARLAAARIVARVAQVERESFDVENFAQACGIARHLAPGLLAELPATPAERQPYRFENGKIVGPPLNAWGSGYVPATIVCEVTAGEAGTGGNYSHYPAEIATRHIQIMLDALNGQAVGTLSA